eukprot:scaffold2151_cov65-Cylindrotheca_fusiformis.AAC.2
MLRRCQKQKGIVRRDDRTDGLLFNTDGEDVEGEWRAFPFCDIAPNVIECDKKLVSLQPHGG